MRPAEWPIMAGHTLLGYVLAVGIDGALHGRFLPEALRALLIWVVFLNGGTLAINSARRSRRGGHRLPQRTAPAAWASPAFQLGTTDRRPADRAYPAARVSNCIRDLFCALDPVLGAAISLQGRRGRRLGDQHVGFRRADAVCRVGGDGSPARSRSSARVAGVRALVRRALSAHSTVSVR